ncbi:MAG: LPS assembly lipoprotein LptE [candidate division Zixibacteria bacterium]|nr:LPS assembly lipoprotein LptE [candidate division Zixibacteria bacterium]
MINKSSKISIIIIFFLSFIGCGVYTFNPRGKSTINSIAVSRFDNQTAEYGLSDLVTDNIIDAFISDGSFKVLPEADAEALLIGNLIRYERKAHTYNENDEVQEYKVEMDFEISLKNNKNNIDDKEIWKERINHIGIYNVETETEENGQDKVIALLVETIINKTTKSW